MAAAIYAGVNPGISLWARGANGTRVPPGMAGAPFPSGSLSGYAAGKGPATTRWIRSSVQLKHATDEGSLRRSPWSSHGSSPNLRTDDVDRDPDFELVFGTAKEHGLW